MDFLGTRKCPLAREKTETRDTLALFRQSLFDGKYSSRDTLNVLSQERQQTARPLARDEMRADGLNESLLQTKKDSDGHHGVKEAMDFRSLNIRRMSELDRLPWFEKNPSGE